MIKVVIIDDEINAREALGKILNHCFPNKFMVVASCDSVDAGVEAINLYDPELVFLDIQMPGKDGFQLIKQFEVVNFEIIFVTGFDQFSLKAIRQSAIDYLEKPVRIPDLISAIKRFESRNNNHFAQKKLNLLLENLRIDEHVKKIALPTMEGFEFISTNNILYCRADGNYCVLHKIDGRTITVSKTLKYVEELLPLNSFQRIHKTYVVNLNYVVKYLKGTKEVELTNGEKLQVSHRKVEEFIDAILQKK
ncbi:MAG: response regulator transcription factor [Flavobacteriaceae bacterium]|nr:response regulator transcription factor [Flavobacteriaceae bacterium]